MKIDIDKLEIKKATKEDLINLKFDCGDDDLNEFLLEDAIKNIESNLSAIFLCKYENNVVGYFALSTDSLSLDEKLEIRYAYYPAIKIGRLAIDTKYQNNNIGSYILKWIAGYIKAIRNYVGVRLISIDAYLDAVNFYKKNKYKCSKKNCPPNGRSNETISLYLDLDRI